MQSKDLLVKKIIFEGIFQIIHITFGLVEGDQYTVSDVSVIGNIPIKPEAYETVIQTQKDKV